MLMEMPAHRALYRRQGQIQYLN